MRRTPPVLIEMPIETRGKVNRYRTDVLTVGESFFVPLNGREVGSVTSSIYTTIRRCQAERPKTQFLVRRARKDGVEGVRCWRIK